MKILISFILLLFYCNLNAQTDSALVLYYPKLIAKYEIYLGKNDSLKKEEYTYFKGRYWHQKTEKVYKDDFVKMLLKLEVNKKIRLTKNCLCDSLVNKIRNSSSYWKMKSEIDKIAREQIGYDNNDFNTFKYSQDNKSSDLSKKCFNEYKTEENELRQKLLVKIESIKKTKEKRLTEFKKNIDSISPEAISMFLSTFNQCSSDLKSLEIIIINEAKLFMQELEKLSDSDFFVFTLKLDSFPKDTNISKMREHLKQKDINSSRKKKVIKKMKTTKG